MSQISKVIFIDEENTRLSPFAGELFRKKLKEKGMDIETGSKGTVVLFPEPANQKVLELALEYGIVLSGHQAQALEDGDFEGNVLILAMDNSSKRRAYESHPEMINIFTLKEYVGENGDIRLPLGESIENYGAVCETIDKLLDLLIQKLKENFEL